MIETLRWEFVYVKHFVIYFAFVMVFSFVTGMVVNWVI